MSAESTLAKLSSTHRNAVIGLAADAQLPLERIADEYCRELAQLEPEARIKQYLPVIASRRVRQRLRRQHLSA